MAEVTPDRRRSSGFWLSFTRVWLPLVIVLAGVVTVTTKADTVTSEVPFENAEKRRRLSRPMNVTYVLASILHAGAAVFYPPSQNHARSH